MAKKNKSKQDSAPPPVRFWLPAAILAFVGVYEIAMALQSHDYAHQAYWSHNDALMGLSWGCFATAALLAVFAPLRRMAVAHLDRLSKGPVRQHVLWISGCFGAIVLWLGFIRFCEYRSFLLPMDTTIAVNQAHNFIRHGLLHMAIYGVNNLSVHFLLQMQMFSPVLLIWDHPLAIIAAEDFFVLSAPIALYGLTVYLTESSMAGAAGLALGISTPYFYELLTANTQMSASASLLPWLMLCVYLRRWWLLAPLLCLMLGGTEAVPFIFFGMGLYVITQKLRDRKNLLLGAGICLAAALTWFGEVTLIKHFGAIGVDYWKNYFGHLAPPDTPTRQILPYMVHHPFHTFFSLFDSRYRWYPVGRVVFYMGLFPLLGLWALLPWMTSIAPNLMSYATPGPTPFFSHHPSYYFDFGLHYGAWMFGPLLWATAHGIRRAYNFLAPRKQEGWILVWALAVSGIGFQHAHRTLNPNFRKEWFDAMPRVEAKIPKRARLWIDEYAAAPVANRRWIELVGWGPAPPTGYDKLFKPDYVLFDKGFVVYAKPPYRDQMLTFFAQNGYRKVADDESIVLLRSPEPAPDPEADVLGWVELPQPDAKLVQQYGRYILEGPTAP